MPFLESLLYFFESLELIALLNVMVGVWAVAFVENRVWASIGLGHELFTLWCGLLLFGFLGDLLSSRDGCSVVVHGILIASVDVYKVVRFIIFDLFWLFGDFGGIVKVFADSFAMDVVLDSILILLVGHEAVHIVVFRVNFGPLLFELGQIWKNLKVGGLVELW